ncbi:MAG: proteasome accessory factor PafA2 family protein, partial [bacterium]|nr:proteasome accessory factor PafA2 family protein [bacterium]
MGQQQVKIRDRVYGVENEFGVLFVFPNGEMLGSAYEEARGILETRMKRKGIRYGIIPLSQHRFTGVWFTNGGMVYIDGSLPEFASPECRRVRDAVAYNKAAEILACNIFAHSRDKNRIRIFKNNIGKKKNGEWQDGALLSRFETYGCHENYLLFRGELFSDNTLRVLMPFLGTRQMYDGAGWWTNPKKNEF